MVKTLIGVVVVAIAVIVVFMFVDPNINVSNTNNDVVLVTSNSTNSNSSIMEGYMSVTIEGEVAKPSSYVVQDDATLEDLISEAGGITDYADTLAYFDDVSLVAGETYYIAPKYDSANVCSLVEVNKININTASYDELVGIKDRNDKTIFTVNVANNIVSYRLENGEFKTLEEITKVSGIAVKTYQKARDYITLHE